MSAICDSQGVLEIRLIGKKIPARQNNKAAHGEINFNLKKFIPNIKILKGNKGPDANNNIWEVTG